MSKWFDIELSGPRRKSRKKRNWVNFLGYFLTAWDFVSCVLAGAMALAFYMVCILDKPLISMENNLFSRDIVFGSLIVASVLRDNGRQKITAWRSVVIMTLVAWKKCFVAFLIVISVAFVTRASDDLARLWMVGWLLIFAVVVTATRVGVGLYLLRLHGRGELRETVAIVGDAVMRARLAARLGGDMHIVGTFGASGLSAASRSTDETDDLAPLMQMSRDGAVDAVILAVDTEPCAEMAYVISRLKSLPVQIAVCPQQGWAALPTSHVRMMGGIPMAIVAEQPIKLWGLLTKTLIDKGLALFFLLLLLPVMLAIAAAITLTSDGPILFRQCRKGWCGDDFEVLKFRTMRIGPPGYGTMFQTQRHDPRCTAVGHLLRRTSLDELPQLLNVLRGDMSLVGPRPHAESLHEIDLAGHDVVAEYAQRHRVKPGITGWAQVHGARGATATLDDLRRRVDYDLYYIEHWSIWLDLLILLRTPFCLTGDNVF